jgi:AraC-like DNA-binding protein
MPKGGNLTFNDPDDYATAFGGACVNLTITGAGHFAARLTRLRLQYSEICWCREDLPRIAYFSFPTDRTILSFPLGGASLAFAGVMLRSGDMVCHSHGERAHQRSTGACQWGLISLSTEEFAKCGKAMEGQPLASSHVEGVRHPARAEALRFRHSFRQACRLADTRIELIRDEKIARALEQEMLDALAHCLVGDPVDALSKRGQHRAAVMARFEEASTEHIDRKLNMPTLCTEIGVAERTLRMCCAEVLGVSPTRYLLLQRLNRARAALRRANPSTASVAEVARNNQFLEFGRFAVTYRTIFGESPSVTLQRDP